MAHINLGNDQPGIIGLMLYRPETAAPLNQLAETLLRGPSPLEPFERELIAAYTSSLNSCNFCMNAHTAASTALSGDEALTRSVMTDMESSPISSKLKTLLRIAAKVREDGRLVQLEDADAARLEGASDEEIHDTVLIAAVFCMFNRYVDGLGTTPAPMEAYPGIGGALAKVGYANSMNPEAMAAMNGG
jgi:uncharacterized peroxidase-related enzyme